MVIFNNNILKMVYILWRFLVDFGKKSKFIFIKIEVINGKKGII